MKGYLSVWRPEGDPPANLGRGLKTPMSKERMDPHRRLCLETTIPLIAGWPADRNEDSSWQPRFSNFSHGAWILVSVLGDLTFSKTRTRMGL